jgi:hypothetical protein
MSEEKDSVTDDRRRYFRITDNVILNYRVVDQASLELGIIQLKSNRMGRDYLQSAMLGMETRLQELIILIGRTSPQVAEALDLLNKKTSMMERMLNADRDNIDLGTLQRPSSEVSLSAGGLSFDSDKALKDGENLEVELILLPDYTYIKAYGKVVSCYREEGQETLRIGVDIEFMREDDREEMIRHVLNRQTQLLMEKRLHEQGINLP